MDQTQQVQRQRSVWDVVIAPAYCLEAIAYNPAEQPKNQVEKELLTRIASIVAPIFYAYQIVLHSFAMLVDSVLCLFLLSPGILLQRALVSTAFSVTNLVSSTLEIPQKLICGPKNIPNYLGNPGRYDMIHHRWEMYLS